MVSRVRPEYLVELGVIKENDPFSVSIRLGGVSYSLEGKIELLPVFGRLYDFQVVFLVEEEHYSTPGEVLLALLHQNHLKRRSRRSRLLKQSNRKLEIAGHSLFDHQARALDDARAERNVNGVDVWESEEGTEMTFYFLEEPDNWGELESELEKVLQYDKCDYKVRLSRYRLS